MGVVLSTKHMIVILVVFSALVVGMCASISITCHNKIQERRRREREYKLRRSKEASVEVGLDLSAGNLEASIIAHQATEIGARRAGMPPGPTPGGTTVLRPEDDDNGCYVPEVSPYSNRVRDPGSARLRFILASAFFFLYFVSYVAFGCSFGS